MLHSSVYPPFRRQLGTMSFIEDMSNLLSQYYLRQFRSQEENNSKVAVPFYNVLSMQSKKH